MNRIRQFAGFTLIEIMISVILMAILVSVSAPLGTLIDQFKLGYASQKAAGSIALARSEAIKRGQTVSICRSTTGLACDTSDPDWSAGWTVFINPNDNNSIDSGEEVIRIYSRLSDSLRMTWNSGNRLSFTQRGTPTASGTFTICSDGRTATDMRLVTVTNTGQTRRSSTTGDCN